MQSGHDVGFYSLVLVNYVARFRIQTRTSHVCVLFYGTHMPEYTMSHNIASITGDRRDDL